MTTQTARRPLVVLLCLSLILAACAAPTAAPTQPPQQIEVTRIVAGTPVVERVVVTATAEPVATRAPASAENPVELHVGVAMTAQELETWLPLFDKLDQDHPEWILVLEQTPQSSLMEKMNANAAAGTLPDVQEIQGLFVNPFIRDGAFIALDDYIADADLDMSDFFPRVMEEWVWEGQTYGIPLVAAPELLYYNRSMFDAAGLEYPSDDWTYDDLREAAIRLTLDDQGRNAADPNFDPTTIKQWGFNTNPGSLAIWAHMYVEPWGGNFCANEACTQVDMDTPENLEALNFWYDLVVNQHAALADPYSGAQTGVPGDPFISGFAAMGFNGFFGIGQLKATGAFPFGVAQPPQGPAARASSLSTRGYAIAANSEYQEEAWKLIQALTSPEFLSAMWALPGHSVPARRSAAQTILDLGGPPDDLSPVLATMEYAHGFRPNGPGAFEAFGAALGITGQVFGGQLSVEDGYAQIESTVNPILK